MRNALPLMAAFSLFACPAPIEAEMVLDVDRTVGDDGYYFEAPPRLWQTFTVTTAGTLAKVGAITRQGALAGGSIVFNDLPVELHLYRAGSDDRPQGEQLAKARLAVDVTDGSMRIADISQFKVAVQPGDRFGLESRPGSLTPIAFSTFLGTDPPGYEGGQLYQANSLSSENPVWTEFVDSPYADLNFRVWIDKGLTLSPGDINGDGTVDLTDFGILKAHFGSAGGREQGDLTGDGRIDLSDFGELKANFGGTAAVPEPATWLSAAISLACLVGARMVGAQGK